MKHSSRPRKTAHLSGSLHQRLNAYALAASAAGVGALALSQSAEGKIIYTPAHAVIGLHHSVHLDLNHDGNNDFTFHESFITTTSVDENHSLVLSVLPAHKNEVWGMADRATALRAGVSVGPKRRFSYAKKLMAVDYYADGTGGSGTCAGPWNNVKNRYLGLKFNIKGETHFGWARLTVTCITTFENHTVTGVLTGYAYETIPNKAIITGKTKGPESSAEEEGAVLTVSTPEAATLGVLATGAPALSIWRRKESVGIAQ